MTYNLIIYKERDYSGATPEYFWTKNVAIVNLFFDEYPHVRDSSIVYSYDNCKNDFDFFNMVLIDHNINISEINELSLSVSDHDPSIYHITTMQIQDDLVEGGMADAQYTSTMNNIVKSYLNMSIMSKFIKDDRFQEYLKEVLLKHLSRVVLLDNGIMNDTMLDGGINRHALKCMGIDYGKSYDIQEGIFAAVDFVMFSKMCEGMEP